MTNRANSKGGNRQPAANFQFLTYPDTSERSPSFDGAAFVQSWARYVGSAHRHWQTRELVLCWSRDGPHPQERETLRARLESDPRNIGSVLSAIDARDEAVDQRIRAAIAAHPS